MFIIRKALVSGTRRLPAFTLTEVLVVLVIVGILVLLALPNLMPLISKAKETEAKLQLKQIYTLEKTYFMEHSKYSNNMEAIDYAHQKLSDEGGSANYRIEIVEASTTTFKAKATAIADFDGDGKFNVWEIDQDEKLEEVIPD